MRQFESGATRDSEQNKIDYEGFLSPLVLRRFGEYMNKHRVQADGQLRDSDNWQKGIPKKAYMKSMLRHFMDVWAVHRQMWSADLEESLCGVLFNAMGYLHEHLKEQYISPAICVVYDEFADPNIDHTAVSRPDLNEAFVDDDMYRSFKLTDAEKQAIRDAKPGDCVPIGVRPVIQPEVKKPFDVKDLKKGDRIKVSFRDVDSGHWLYSAYTKANAIAVYDSPWDSIDSRHEVTLDGTPCSCKAGEIIGRAD